MRLGRKIFLFYGSVLVVAGWLLAGCAHDRYSLSDSSKRISERHKFIADVTCTSAKPYYFTNFRDQFRWGVMPPRVRWTAAFRVDRMIKGKVDVSEFRLNDSRDKATPFSEFVGGFRFQTNKSYRVGFDGIANGNVRGLEIFTNAENVGAYEWVPNVDSGGGMLPTASQRFGDSLPERVHIADFIGIISVTNVMLHGYQDGRPPNGFSTNCIGFGTVERKLKGTRTPGTPVPSWKECALNIEIVK